MKKLTFLLLLFFTVVAPSIARDSVMVNYKERRAAIREELFTMPRSQVALGIGVPPSVLKHRCPNSDGYYWNSETFLPLFSAQYAYRVVQFLEIGGSLGYGYESSRYISVAERKPIGWDETHSFAVSVFARYAWLNSRWVSLYSSFGAFAYWDYTQTVIRDSRSRRFSSFLDSPILPDITVIGIRVGRRLFGYVEPFSLNGRGFMFNAGMGYKF